MSEKAVMKVVINCYVHHGAGQGLLFLPVWTLFLELSLQPWHILGMRLLVFNNAVEVTVWVQDRVN